MSDHDDVAEVTDDGFQAQVLQSDLPVMVDMWAPWCGPCRMVSPTIAELASENAGKIKACKMNVDENPGTAARFGITAIPTVLFFKGGQELEALRAIGARPKANYQAVIDKVTAD